MGKQIASDSGYVYIVECNGYFKIGKTLSVESRISQIQTGSPYKIKLIASFKSKNHSEDEKAIHEILSEFSVRGEWFSIPTEKMALLHEWFKTSVSSSSNDKIQVADESVRKRSGFTEWESRYKGFHHGHEILIQELFEKQLYAFHFVRQEPEYVVARAVEVKDDFALLYVYGILVDNNFAVPSRERWEPNFIATIERFSNSNMSWLAALSASVHCFY